PQSHPELLQAPESRKPPEQPDDSEQSRRHRSPESILGDNNSPQPRHGMPDSIPPAAFHLTGSLEHSERRRLADPSLVQLTCSLQPFQSPHAEAPSAAFSQVPQDAADRYNNANRRGKYSLMKAQRQPIRLLLAPPALLLALSPVQSTDKHAR